MESVFKIKYTGSAINDLDKILTYLSNYNNPLILENFRKEIDNNIQRIRQFPESNAVVFSQNGYDYRKMVVRSYIFVYIINDLNSEIIIFRIFHELEDYQNKLGCR